MKNWATPAMEELNVVFTENGKDMTQSYDEIRVDQDGNYWVSFQSGKDSNRLCVLI